MSSTIQAGEVGRAAPTNWLRRAVGWGLLLGGNGDMCVCLDAISPSKPVRAAILVHDEPPVVTDDCASSRLELALKYEDGTVRRRVLSRISDASQAKIMAAKTVLVGEVDGEARRFLYVAEVRKAPLRSAMKWGILVGGNGDMCACFKAVSATEPVAACVFVHDTAPKVTEDCPSSRLEIALRYADGRIVRRILSEIAQEVESKVAQAETVVVSETEGEQVKFVYVARVQKVKPSV